MAAKIFVNKSFGNQILAINQSGPKEESLITRRVTSKRNWESTPKDERPSEACIE
jgi:hypothetical protein